MSVLATAPAGTTAAPDLHLSVPNAPRWWVWFAVWGGFIAVILAATRVVPPMADPIEYRAVTLILISFLDVFSWGTVLAAAVWIGRALPIDDSHPLPRLVLHAAAGLVIVLLRYWIFQGFAYAITLSPSPPSWDRILNNLAFGLLIYSLMFGVGYAIMAHHRLREREIAASRLQTELARAHIMALRMQLNPHFLFNTLNSISMLVREADNDTAVRMLARLSDLLRHVLEDVGVQEVPLREELEFIQRYLAIEQIRFQDRLRVRVEVEPGLLDVLVPNLVLQPLVENAIRHGIARSSSAGRLEIAASRDGDRVLLFVRDDGPGLAAGSTRSLEGGVGLRNTRARLQHLYGAAARVDLGDVEGGGVLALVVLPLRHGGEMERREAVA